VRARVQVTTLGLLLLLPLLLLGCAGRSSGEADAVGEMGMNAGGAMGSGVIASADEAILEISSSQVETGSVALARVVAPADGWVVAHSALAPGGVMGAIAVRRGESRNVVVPVDTADTATVRLALHVDRGTRGKLEYDPDQVERSFDKPVLADRRPVEAVVALPGLGVPVLPHEITLWAEDQKAGKEIILRHVLAPPSSWIAVYVVEDGLPQGRVGQLSFSGEATHVRIPVKGVESGDELSVVLLTDRGAPGRLEYEPTAWVRSADVPLRSGDEVVLKRLRLQ